MWEADWLQVELGLGPVVHKHARIPVISENLDHILQSVSPPFSPFTDASRRTQGHKQPGFMLRQTEDKLYDRGIRKAGGLGLRLLS